MSGGEPREPALRDVLIAMAEVDQVAALRCLELSDADPRLRGKFLMHIPRDQWLPDFFDAEALTRRHAVRMAEVVGRYGWPGRSLVGAEGSAAAWLLVQHANSELQRRCLPILALAVKAGEADAEHLAMVTDRLELQEGRLQVYGTHLAMTADGGREAVSGVVDAAVLDDRRVAIGLASWREYVEAVS